VKVLLDTNVFLMHFLDRGRLDTSWSEAISDADQAFLSALSMWEIAILHAKGRLPISGAISAFVHEGMNELQLLPLSITSQHVLATAALPAIHGDPFDRLLVAQAHCERLTIMTTDRTIPRYDVSVFGHKPRKAKRP
jgi:PIN domain nuclease of toxin-antitoxin system